jgi:putative serine protease htrA (fragment)
MNRDYENGFNDEFTEVNETGEVIENNEITEEIKCEEAAPFMQDINGEESIQLTQKEDAESEQGVHVAQDVESEQGVKDVENEQCAHVSQDINNAENTQAHETFATDEGRSRARKKTGFVKKLATIVSSAALFGAIAGGTMIAVEHAFGPKVQTKTETIVIGKQNNETSEAKVNNAISTGTATANKIGDVSDIVSKAMPSVVAINATSRFSGYTWFGEKETYESDSSGSGIIIGNNSEELLIVTNNHVVEDTKKLSVVFIDGKEVKATVKGGDSDADIAVIAVKFSDLSDETKNSIQVATIGDSDKLKVGEGVVAIGNALGYGQSVTVGYVSALDRDVQIDEKTTRKLLQTDAAINPGNSGGALLNSEGELIAINSAKYSSTSVEGMGYAIPINEVQELIENLSKRETRTVVEENEQGYLGIQGQNIDETMSKSYDMPEGVYVYKIVEDGAAANSDLKEKDIITKMDAQSIKSMKELKEALTYYKTGESVELTIQRLDGSEYKEQNITVVLGKKPETDSDK